MKVALRLASQVLFLLLCLRFAQGQTTINVPADQKTIQAGIDAAPAGATVLVAPGTYYENIDFKGKAITVTSSGGAATTIIDGSKGQNAAVSFIKGEGRTSILNGFTIRGGGAETQDGYLTDSTLGGIYILLGQPIISNNIITHNHCHSIFSNGSSPLIENNEIDNTLDTTGYCGFAGGTAIWLSGSLSYYNGGNNSVQVPATVLGNTIQNNTESGLDDAGGNGGVGVAVWGADALIEANIIRNNSTQGEGAIYAFNTDLVMVIGNVIYGNAANSGSGGVDLEPPEESAGPFIGIIASNTIYGNTLKYDGANLGSVPGTQVFLSGNLGQYLMVNNVVVGTTSSIPAVACGDVYNYLSYTPLVFDHNDIYNAGGAAYGGPCLDGTGTYGNISVDPQFSDAAGGDFHLKSGSPAIDTGNNSAPMLLATDIAGAARIQDATALAHPVVDMGAYEAAGQTSVIPTFLTLTPSTYYPNGSGFGNPVTFTLTANLASTAGVPAGPITFYEDLKSIGTVAADSTGTAVLTPTGIAPGLHAFVATYDGQGGFPAAVSVKFYILFPKATPEIDITSAPNPSLLNTNVTFTVSVSSPDGSIPSPIAITDYPSTTPLATLTPDATGKATYTTSTLAVGAHNITASFAGNATDNAASGNVVQNVVNGYPVMVSLFTSGSPSNYLQPVTFSANVSASVGGTPTGTVTFLDGTTAFSTQTLNGTGNASATISTLTPTPNGTFHSITAQYNPTGSFAGGLATIEQMVNGLASATALTVTPTSGPTTGQYTMTAVVTNASGTSTSPMPTGTVNFYYGGGSQAEVATLVNGVATFNATNLSAGQNTVTAAYHGDTLYAASSSNAVVVTVTAPATALTLAASADPVAALAPVSFTAHLSVAGKAAGAGVPLTLTLEGPGGTSSAALTTDATGAASFTSPGLLPGQYTATVSFAGSAALAAATPVSVAETVFANATATALTISQSPGFQNQPETLTAVVTAATGVSLPAGTMVFTDGGTQIGSASVLASAAAGASNVAGSATLTTSGLAVGTHTIVASYAPSSSAFLASQSAAVPVTIELQDFALTASPPAMQLQTEHHGSMTLTLTSLGSFNGPVTLRCAGIPADWITCEVPGSAIALGANATVPVTMTIDTDAILNFKASGWRGDAPLGMKQGRAIGFAGVLLLGLLGRRKRRRMLTRSLLAVIALAVTAGAGIGCGGHYPASTPPGTYNVAVIATGRTAGAAAAVSHTLNITLTVKPR